MNRPILTVALALSIATAASAQVTKCITKFEPAEGFAPGDEVLFQEPTLSGSTDGIVTGDDDFGNAISNSQVVDWFGLPSNAYEISFPWTDPTNTTTAGVRCTTFNALNLERPSIHLGGRIRFKMAVTAFDYVSRTVPIGPQIQDGSASILMCLVVSESGNDLPLGDPDSGGDFEFIYLPGSEVIPPIGSNGLIGIPAGGKRFAATTSAWPPSALDFVQVEFDLSTITSNSIRGFANDGNGIDTAGDGVLDATLAGPGSVNRGYLEAIIFTPDPADPTSEYFFIYIDDVEFEAPVADSTITPPTVGQPVVTTDTSVTVLTKQDLCAGTEVDLARLFVNGSFVGSAAPVAGQATIAVAGLQSGDILTAKQDLGVTTSGFSAPVVVFEPGVIMADNFETYTTQEDLNAFWSNSINFPTPPDARLLLSTGSAASCQNLIKEENPSGSDGARLFRPIGSVNGTDADPLVVTWNFQHRGASNASGERTRFELASYGGAFSTALTARQSGTTGIIFENGPGTIPLPQTLDEYNILLVGANTTGFFDGNQSIGTNGEIANTGIARAPDVWHTMQIEVRSNVINYFIDGVLANPVDTNGVPIWPGGVPRPSNLAYDHIVIGQGFSNNGPAMLFDNVAVTVGTTGFPFAPPVSTASPTISGNLIPGGTVVTVIDVDSNATEVAVQVNGAEVASTNGVGEFLDNTAVITVGALSDGASVTATQTVGGIESCFSTPVVVTSPPVTVESPLVPSQTTVDVSNLEEGIATTVTVYVDLGGGSQTQIGQVLNPATDPVTVPVTALVNGDNIVATQTIGGAESANSAAVTVGSPAPTLPGPVAVGDTVVTVNDVHPLADKVTVLVNGTTAGFEDVSTSALASVDVTLGASLFVDETVTATQTIGGVVSPESNAFTITLPMCLILFEDDFETDTSANWNVNILDEASTNDAAATFNWDYGTLGGVPAAPNGSGTTFGLRLEANNFTDSPNPPDENAAVTVSPVGQSFTTNGYRLVLDMWINITSGSGSTEFFTVGAGYNDVTPNLAAPNGSVTDADSGDGPWFAISGEGGASQDVRAYKDTFVQAPATGQFAAGTQITANNTNADQFYTDLFGPAGALPAGSAGDAWHLVEVTVLGGQARWQINNTPIVTLDNAVTQSIDLSGNVSIGYMDVFNSVSSVPAEAFGLADNVKVLVPHTPGTNGDYDGDAVVDADDVRYIPECLAGPNNTPVPTTLGLNCANACETAFDFDADGDVDLRDAAEFQRLFP